VACDGPSLLALVVHDGRSRALESELVALAREALAAARPGAVAVTLRSLEPARALLAAHGVDAEARARLLEDPRSLASPALPPVDAALEGAPQGAETPEQLEKVLLAFLGRLRFKTYGTRTPEEVAARLAGRLSRTLPAVARRIQAARAELLELASLDGRPDEVLAKATTVLSGHASALEPLRTQLAELDRLGVAVARLELAGSPGPLDPSWRIEALGAGALARGGSFDERGLRGALAEIDLGALGAVEPTARIDLLVIPVTGEELAAAHAFALEARRAGLTAELDPSGRNLRSALRAASRRGVAFAAILGEREVREGFVQVKDLRREEQASVPRSEAPAHIASLSRSGAPPRVPGTAPSS
jgi:hypothetical protein